MNDAIITYFRLASYVLVILVSGISYVKHCRAKVLVGNFLFAITLFFLLLITRFYDIGHSRELGLALQTLGTIVWAVFHVADFLQNGDRRRMRR